MAEPDVVPALVALGFSLNESRAYAALLQDSPATGYEVGVRAQIPRSAVYGVLRGDWIIIGANVVSLALLLGILFFKVRDMARAGAGDAG